MELVVNDQEGPEAACVGGLWHALSGSSDNLGVAAVSYETNEL